MGKFGLGFKIKRSIIRTLRPNKVDVRLYLIKTFLNIQVRLLDRFLPERSPTFPQTQLVDSMYRRMFQAFRLDQAQGAFWDDGEFDPDGENIEGDGNFERLLRVSRKLLIRVGEDDRYYREWIGLSILLAHGEYEAWLKELTPQQLKYWCRAQWYVAPDCLSDEAVLEVKDRLAPDVLAYYLHILASKRYSKPNLSR